MSNRPSLRDKPFNSLSINRKKQGGGARPISNLTPKPDLPSSPVKSSEIERAQWLRQRLERAETTRYETSSSDDDKSPPKSDFTREIGLIRQEVDTMNNKEIDNKTTEGGESEEARDELKGTDVSGSTISITRLGLDKPGKIDLELRSITYNDKVYRSNRFETLYLQISASEKYIYLTSNERILPNLVMSKEQVAAFYFAEYSIFIQLQGSAGFILGKHTGRDQYLRDYFKNQTYWEVSWNDNIDEDQLERFVKSQREASSSHVLDLQRVSPRKTAERLSSLESARATRSQSRKNTVGNDSAMPISIEEFHEDLILTPRETPSEFTPDLKHKFGSNKSFTIGYSDFKTLYNNDWINDSVIDFFIEYEIDNVTHKKHLIDPNEIYAFNSFFFTKLVTSNTSEKPDYYANIRRWVSKLDLLKYPYIVMPINENAHWYCCIIRGMPGIKEQEKAKKKEGIENTQDQKKLDHVDLVRQQLQKAMSLPESQEKYDKFNISDDNIGSEHEETADGVSEEEEESQNKNKPIVEIFVLDSLSQKHKNISWPLKKFIIDYCKDKYNIEVSKTQIRVQSARVPKQNNFNDCGIHVIYNVRKWLNNISECEKIWRGSYSKNATRKMFLAEERNGMRNQLKDILKELHRKQCQNEQQDQKETTPEDESEDDIQVIECTNPQENEQKETEQKHSGEKKSDQNEPEAKENEQTENANESEPIEKSYATIRTLDPKATLTNIGLGQKFAGHHLSKLVIDLLNEVFPKRNVDVPHEQAEAAATLIKDINGATQLDDSVKQNWLKFAQTIERHQQKDIPVRPKDQPFRIEHQQPFGSESPSFFHASSGGLEEILAEPLEPKSHPKTDDSDDINQSVNGVNQLCISRGQSSHSPRSNFKKDFRSLKSPPSRSPKQDFDRQSRPSHPSSPAPRSPSKRRKIL